MPSWEGSNRIMESNSWPHAGHPKNHSLHLRALYKRFSNSGWCRDHFPGGAHSSAQPLSGWKTFSWYLPYTSPASDSCHFLKPCNWSQECRYRCLSLFVPRVKESIAHYHYFLAVCHLPSTTAVSAVQFFYLWRGDTQVQKLLLAEPRHCGSCMKYSLSYDYEEIGKQKCFSETV